MLTSHINNIIYPLYKYVDHENVIKHLLICKLILVTSMYIFLKGLWNTVTSVYNLLSDLRFVSRFDMLIDHSYNIMYTLDRH